MRHPRTIFFLITINTYTMKKILLFTICLMACLGLWAQEANAIKVAIASATATSQHSGNEATNAIDGNTGTIWHTNWSSIPEFPVTLTLTLREDSHVDFVRYIPRQDGSVNGRWDVVTVAYSTELNGDSFTEVGTYTLNASKNSNDLYGDYGTTCRRIRFTIQSGGSDSGKNFASAAEIEAYDFSKVKAALSQCFTDNMYVALKPEVTSSEGIEEVVTKTLVDNMLDDAEAYKKFRVGEYKAYMPLESLKRMLGVNSYYSAYENPTGVYLKKGESCLVMVEGIGEDPVNIKMKNWLVNEESSSYKLRNGLNYITALTEGNLFVDYYTDNYKNAPAVKIHFINAPVQGYWDHDTMTADDWTQILSNKQEDDNTILVVQTKHVEVAYPVSSWKQYCPEPADVDSLMKMYQQILWAERDILGVEKYKIEYPNRQFSYVVKEFSGGAMAAGGEGTLTPVYSMHGVMTPDGKDLWVWGLAHEFGHTNQINPGLRWSGCIEVTNNIYSSWAELHVNNGSGYLRLEDEVMTNGEFRMRGGRMQAYFEEGLRKKLPWMLHEGQDFYKDTPKTVEVDGIDADGNSIGKVTTTKRSYDHFVKLAPFWQLNLWGTMAERCPDIIPMTIQGIRTQRSTSDFSAICNTAGKEQMNWMKLACDSAKINLLPFFEKAGMLRPINEYIDSWNIITEEMIDELKAYVVNQGYPTPTEEINYINGHNYHIYRDKKKLNVTAMQGELNGDMVTIQHSVAQNAVAFETYNANDELIRITMYGLGSDEAHSYTQVLFPGDAAYIKAVGYDGTRKKVYECSYPVELTTDATAPKLYTIRTKRDGGPVLQYGAESGMFSVVTEVEKAPAQAFYFMLGDNNRQVYVYPYLAEGKVLAAADVTDGASKAKAMAKGSAQYEQWSFVEQADGYYNLQPVGTSTYLSHFGGGTNLMGFYSSSASSDPGSLLKFESTTVEGSYAYQLLKNYYTTQAKVAGSNISGSDATGYYPASLAEAYNAAYADATELLGSMTNSDEAYQEAYEALVAANEALVINMPQADEYYVIRSAHNGYANGALVYANPADNKMYWSKDKGVSDATAIWTFVASEVEGMYHICNLHSGTSFNGFINNNPSPLSEAAGEVSIVSLSTDGQVGFKCNSTMMHAQQTGAAIVNYSTEANDGSAWRIEKVSAEQMTSVKHDVTVGTHLYTSLYLNYPTTIPTGVEAYIAVEPSAETIKLVKLAGDVLPANTGVILYSETPATYSFSYTASAATDDVEENLLQGSAYVKYVGDGAYKYYIFGQKNGEVGLYWARMDYDADGNKIEGEDKGSHFKASANKVYFAQPNTASLASGIRFVKETTGIDVVESAETAEPEIYTLYGQRISKVAASGIYIINGEKRYINVK